jgi:hypothetical protein
MGVVEITERDRKTVYYVHNAQAATLIGNTNKKVELTQEQFESVYLRGNITLVINTASMIKLETLMPIVRGSVKVDLETCKGATDIFIFKNEGKYVFKVGSRIDTLEEPIEFRECNENELELTSQIMMAACLQSTVGLRYLRSTRIWFAYNDSVDKLWETCSGKEDMPSVEVEVNKLNGEDDAYNTIARWNEQLQHGKILGDSSNNEEFYYNIGEEAVQNILNEEFAKWQGMLNKL